MVFFDAFWSVLTFVIVMKNVADYVMVLVLNFDGDRIRLGGGAWGSRAAACGGASGFRWKGTLTY